MCLQSNFLKKNTPWDKSFQKRTQNLDSVEYFYVKFDNTNA